MGQNFTQQSVSGFIPSAVCAQIELIGWTSDTLGTLNELVCTIGRHVQFIAANARNFGCYAPIDSEEGVVGANINVIERTERNRHSTYLVFVTLFLI